MVVIAAVRNDDGVFVRQALASLWLADRRRVRRDALLRKAGGIFARFSRGVSRAVDELPDSRLGHKSHDQHRGRNAWSHRPLSSRDLRTVPDSIHRDICRVRRTMGSPLDRSVPVRAKNGHRDWSSLVRSPRCWRDGHLLHRLADMRAAAGPGAGDATAFFPDMSRGWTEEGLWLLPVLIFLVNIGLQWWASWYPGAEPGGGGYIAQRIFSAKDERNGVLSVLWFNIAHYALRPWPWILTASAAIVLYPHLEHPETGYMLVVSQHVPPALRGVVIAGFMAAFMSTIATQLNWGASYLVSDFYRRFIKT